jgi:hypothetical protein
MILLNKLFSTIVLLILVFNHSFAATYKFLDFGAKENQLSTEAFQKAVKRKRMPGMTRVFFTAPIWSEELPVFFSHWIECKDVINLFIENFSGSGNPNSPASQKLKTDNVTFRK